MPSLSSFVATRMTVAIASGLTLLLCASAETLAGGQSTTATAPATVERIGPSLLRLGQVRVDTARREVSVSGHINQVRVLEWVANTIGGLKAYESAITADTDAITFNAALLLIGLDKAHARVPVRHFDPEPPRGDPVELWVEWSVQSQRKRVRIEQLLLDMRTKTTLPEGQWVYTGSTFIPDTNDYMAQMDGVLIGFVHSPAPIIENPGAGAVGAFGQVVLNAELVAPGTPVTLIVKALPVSTQ